MSNNDEVQIGLSGKPIRKLSKKKAHQRYSVRGKSVPGCSSICRLGEMNEGLMKWAWDLGQQGIDFRKSRDEAADIGTCTHFLIECFLAEEEADMSDYAPFVTDKARQGFGKFMEFWSGGGFSGVHSELQMTSLLYEYGGTVDCVALDRDGKRTLLDFKCVKRVYDSHAFQLAGYRQLCDENHPETWLERYAIIRIPKDESKVEERWYNDLDWQWRVFLAQLELYRVLKEKRS